MSFKRINASVGAGSTGSSLTDAQAATLERFEVRTIDDFSDTPKGFELLPPHKEQRSGGLYACTSYSAAAAGLTMNCSVKQSDGDGSNAATPIGFAYNVGLGTIDASIGLDNITAKDADGEFYYMTFCLGNSTHTDDTNFGVLLRKDGLNAYKLHKYHMRAGASSPVKDGGTTLSNAQIEGGFRLRVEWDSVEGGFRSFYSLDSGASYTELGGGSCPTGYVSPITDSTSITTNVVHTWSRFHEGRALFFLMGTNQNLTSGFWTARCTDITLHEV